MTRNLLWKLAGIAFLAMGTFAVSPALAQMAGSGSMSGMNGSQMGMPNGGMNTGMNRPGMQPGTPGMGQNMLQNSMERNFLANALNDVRAETDLSKLALKKTTNDGVKKLARQVIADNHTLENSLNQEVMGNSFPMIGGLPGQFRKTEKKMKELTGIQFDGTYLSEILGYVKNDQKVSRDASASMNLPSLSPTILQMRNLSDNRVQQIKQLAQSENIKFQ